MIVSGAVAATSLTAASDSALRDSAEPSAGSLSANRRLGSIAPRSTSRTI
jgi:hypothetical protein